MNSTIQRFASAGEGGERDSDEDAPRFYYTNESLPALVAGLTPQRSDRILAICGSGDQAFAMLESGAKVVAIDINPIQLEYAIARTEALAKRDLKRFFNLCNTKLFEGKRTKDYFMQEGRLDKISQNLSNLSFRDGNINANEALDDLGMFDKIYGSNAIIHYDEREEVLPFLKRNGLFYTATGDDSNVAFQLHPLVVLHRFKVDSRRSQNAMKYQRHGKLRWQYGVLVKK